MSIARASFANGLRVGIFIALVGPVIGALTFLAGLFAVEAMEMFASGTGGDLATRVGNLSLAVLLIGFLTGAIPASLAGIAAGVITARSGGFSASFAMWLALASALVLPVLSALASLGQPGTGDAAHYGSLSIFYGLVAGVSLIAALVCRWLLLKLGWIAPTVA